MLEETAAARAGKRKNAELHNLITQLNSPVSPEVVDIKKRKVDLEEKRLDAEKQARIDDRAMTLDRERERLAHEIQFFREKARVEMEMFTATDRRLALDRDLERQKMENQKELELKRLEADARSREQREAFMERILLALVEKKKPEDG